MNRVEPAEVLGAQLDAAGADVFDQMVRIAGSGDHQQMRPALQRPGEADLDGADAKGLRDRCQLIGVRFSSTWPRSRSGSAMGSQAPEESRDGPTLVAMTRSSG